MREFELRPEGGVLPWTVGSHLNVQVLIDGRPETRSYSLVGLPHEAAAADVYRIAVKRAEPGRGGSRHMWSLETGAELRIGEPNNHFELPLTAHAVPAGGRRHRHHADRRHGADAGRARCRRAHVLRRAQRRRTGVRRPLRSSARRPAADLHRRRAASAWTSASEIAALPPRAQLLICGPLPLLEAVREAWAQTARPARRPALRDLRLQRHRGRRGLLGRSCRATACDFRCRPTARCSTCWKTPASTRLYDCRRGECGLCAVDIVAVARHAGPPRRVLQRAREGGEPAPVRLRLARVRRRRRARPGLAARLILPRARRRATASLHSRPRSPPHSAPSPETP